MRRIWRAPFLFCILIITAHADELCCSCMSQSHSPFVAATVPGSDCGITCSSNGGSWSRTSRIVTGTCQNPGTNAGQRKEPPTQQYIASEAKYAIYHQGARIWIGDGDDMLAGEALRAALVGVSETDTSAIQAATVDEYSDSDLRSGVRVGVAACIAERNIAKDFAWVCGHERAGNVIRGTLAKKDYDSIRHIFSMAEKHDDELRNRIYCTNNRQIAELVANHCPAPFPAPPPADKGGDRGQGAGHN